MPKVYLYHHMYVVFACMLRNMFWYCMYTDGERVRCVEPRCGLLSLTPDLYSVERDA